MSPQHNLAVVDFDRARSEEFSVREADAAASKSKDPGSSKGEFRLRERPVAESETASVGAGSKKKKKGQVAHVRWSEQDEVLEFQVQTP